MVKILDIETAISFQTLPLKTLYNWFNYALGKVDTSVEIGSKKMPAIEGHPIQTLVDNFVLNEHKHKSQGHSHMYK